MMNPARSMCGCTTAQSGTPIDRADPPIRGAPVEPLAVLAAEDRPFVTFADDEINGASGPRHEWDHRGLVSLAHDRQGPVPAQDGEILDVGAARFGDPQPVEAEQHGQGGVHRVVPFGSEQEGAELGAVHPVPLGLGTLGRRMYWAGLAGMRPSMSANR